MNLISDINLRWFDESALLEKDPRKLTETFLASLGITSDVAADIVEVLFKARAVDRGLTTAEVREGMVMLRKQRKEDFSGLTVRNVQVWIRYFKEIKLVDRVGDRVRFSGNKKPSKVFAEYTRPLIEESASFVEKLLKKTEEAYGIK